MSLINFRKNRPPVTLAPSGRVQRELITPEGVPLRLELARRGERAAAFALDFLFLGIGIVVVSLGMGFLLGALSSGRGFLIFFLLFIFLARNFYFTFFEIRWQGQTLGKRMMKIKVINRGEGPLKADAIFARNLMREVELFLPMTLLMGSGGFAGATQWTMVFALIWAFILVFFPLFNRDNLRVGDLIAGTLVVHKIDQPLLDDMVGVAADEEPSDIHFTAAQLDAYGIYELQRLEELLRTDAFWRQPEQQHTIAGVIAKKIGWEGDEPVTRTREFLTVFYRGLRNRLEGQLLMGKRRANKHEKV